jgi:hypothetical protein
MESITVIGMDKFEFSELLHQAIKEELQNILKEINSKGIVEMFFITAWLYNLLHRQISYSPFGLLYYELI